MGMSAQEMLTRFADQILTDKRVGDTHLMLTENFDLRGIKNKQEIVDSTPLLKGWMAFVNAKCTLCHMMHVDDKESYVRIKLPPSLKGTSGEYMRKQIYNRTKNHYIF